MRLVQCYLILFTFAAVGLAQPGSPYAPPNGLVTEEVDQTLHWNTAAGATGYQIEVDTLSGFPSPVIQASTTNDSLPFTGTANHTYYWRVITQYAGSSDTSGSYRFTLVDIAQFSGLELWLRSDSGITIDGSNRVSQWLDQSPKVHVISQANAGLRPSYITNPTSLSKPVARFDGSDDILNAGIPLNSTFHVYIIAKSDPSGNVYQALLGTTGVGSVPAGSFCFFYQGGSVPFRTNGTNDALAFINVGSYNLLRVFSESPNVVSAAGNESPLSTNSTSNTNFNGDGFAIGGPNKSGRILKGDVAELIYYTVSQPSTTRTLIRKYLYQKYYPPVSLGPDITIAQGYCNTTLQAQTYFTSYLWSTGATTNSIQIGKSGSYWVSATDQFGSVYRDTVEVNYLEEPQKFSNATICAGDVLKLKLNSIPGSYQVTWSDGTLTDSIEIASAGDYWYQVEDNGNCVYQSDTFTVTVDPFPLQNFFPEDTTLCGGNKLVVTGLHGLTPTWSTGSNDTVIIVNQSGSYWVHVDNNNGCRAADTVDVLITGLAPVVKFSTDSTCVNVPVQFMDSSSTQDQSTIVQWQWDFGDGFGATQQNPTHAYTAMGNYPVTLTVTTDSGCSAVASKNAWITVAPTVSISTAPIDSSCLGAVVQFSAMVNTAPGNMTTDWNWDFGDAGQSSASQPTHIYGSIGSYTVQLDITTALGCTANTQIIYKVLDPATLGTPVILPYSPANNYLVTDTTLLFRWNPDALIYAYRLEIAADTGFQQLLIAKPFIQSDSVLVGLSGATSVDTMYWRVIGYSVCNDTLTSGWKRLLRFSPSTLTGLSLWLRAEDGILTGSNGNVAQWDDVRGNGLSAVQATIGLRPKPIVNPGGLQASRSIRFDGNDDLLTLPLSMDTTRTLVILYREISGGNIFQSLLGTNGVGSQGSGTFSLFATSGQRVSFRSNGTTDSDVNITTLDYNIIQAERSGNTVIVRHNNFQTGSNGNHSASFNAAPIVLAGPNSSGRILKGDVIEVMGFKAVPSATDRNQLYRYFQYKYAPPVNLGPDITVEYGFCDTTISAAKSWYRYYQWSTGDTTPSIAVNQPGSYSVVVSDVFGNISSDTVDLIHPVKLLPKFNTICMGDTLTWDTKLSTNAYTISWPDGSGNSTFDITEEGYYWVTIQNQNGCSLTDTIYVDVDSFMVQASLGPDANLCAGNEIGLTVGANEAVSYLWSTGDTTPKTTVQNTGAYSLSVTNIHGCMARDTIQVQIIGIVPTVDFSATNLCEGQAAQFTDQSQPAAGDVLNMWDWEFGDASTSILQNPLHTYADSGTYHITLTVSTANGCANARTKPFFVNPPPQLDFDFSPQNPCQLDAIQFIDQSTVFNGSMSQWHWNFGDGDTSILQNPVHTYKNSGLYDVVLIGTSDQGCRDTLLKSVLIKGSPIAYFGYGPACTGQLIQFLDSSDQSQSSPINKWSWDFGDGTNSSTRNPAHIFNTPGTYAVELEVQATSGCTGDTTIQVLVSQSPSAAFAPDTACVGTGVQFLDQTDTFNVSLSSWQWHFGDGSTSNARNPVHTYPNAGIYNVKLSVENTVGCTDSVTAPVYISPNPMAGFSFNPSYGAAPIDITFQPTNSGANTFAWYVEDSLGQRTFAGNQTNQVYTFTANGVYSVTQIVTNPNGCSDTITRELFVAIPILDLWAEKLILVQDILPDGTYKVNMAAQVRNKGSRVVTNFDLFATLGAGSTIVETWEGTLRPGETIVHQFQSAFFVTDASNHPFICIEAKNINANEPDDYPNDNIKCEPIGDIIKVLDPYPSPASSSVTLDVVIPRAEQLTVRIFNSVGQEARTVLDGKGGKGLNRFVVPTANLANGTYFVRVRYREEVYVKAFVVGK